MAETLIFQAWERSDIFKLAADPGGPIARLAGDVPLELSDRESGNLSEFSAAFQIMGPGDVTALNVSRAIVSVYPEAGSGSAETTKCVYAELAATDLFSRHTSQLAAGKVLRPWIVLVVGTLSEGDVVGDIALQPDNMVQLYSAATQSHPLVDSARWAHIQYSLRGVHPEFDTLNLPENEEQLRALIASEGGKPLVRLISPRGLEPNKLHLAAIIPAFTPEGNDQWAPGATVSVQAYHHWQFRTGPAGDFRTLAARLRTGEVTGDMGSSALVYDRVEPAANLRVRGAITQINIQDDPIPPKVRDDTAALTAPLFDERGRPVVAPPLYGAAWVDNPKATAWGRDANDDPRNRGSAGLGSAAGIALQDTIVDAVKEQAGAFLIAAQRIRQLTMGVTAAASLWNRRLPQDPMRRLQLYGPSMRRIVSKQGTVLSQVAGGLHPLPPAIFSSAARRVFRQGPARTALARDGAADAVNVLPLANECPPPSEENPRGLPHANTFTGAFGLPTFDEMIKKFLNDRALNDNALLHALDILYDQAPQEIKDRLKDFIRKLYDLVAAGIPLNYGMIMELVRVLSQHPPKTEDIEFFLKFWDSFPNDGGDSISLGKGIEDLNTEPPNRPCKPIDLGELEKALTNAIDPTQPGAWIVVRVLKNIEGLTEPKLAPVEFCTGVDLPSWRFLRDSAPEWLLPGVGQLRPDSVYPFESNPLFVDAFLLGLNTQTLAELRWRNLPLATGCTPLKMFWGRIDPTTNTRVNDIHDVKNWDTGSVLGNTTTHQPPNLGNKNLVVVFRSDLFRRYPRTIVSGVQAKQDAQGNSLWDNANLPDDTCVRQWPIFQGTIGEDVTFFGFPLTPEEAQAYWIVLEEPNTGYNFYNEHKDNTQVQIENNGGDYAKRHLVQPIRVLIKGGEFIPE